MNTLPTTPLSELEKQIAVLREQTAELPAVTDAATYENALPMLKKWAKVARDVEYQRNKIGGPFYRAYKQVNEMAKDITAKIDRDRAPLARAVAAWEDERDREQREAMQARAAKVSGRRRALTSLSDVYERDGAFWLNATNLLTLWDVENLDDEGFAEQMVRIEKVHTGHLQQLRDLEELLRAREAVAEKSAPVVVKGLSPITLSAAPTRNGFLRAAIDAILCNYIEDEDRIELATQEIMAAIGLH